MARDTEGLLGKAKEKEPDVKTEKPARKEDQTGMCETEKLCVDESSSLCFFAFK